MTLTHILLGSTVSSVQRLVSLCCIQDSVLYSLKRTFKMYPSCASAHLDHYSVQKGFVIPGSCGDLR